eukprot:16271190-Heterocapsa_arctica.AAC.1
MLKAKQIQMHKRERTNKRNTKHTEPEEKENFMDKSDTEDNNTGTAIHNDNNRSGREETETFPDKSNSEDKPVVNSKFQVENNRKMFQQFLDQREERDKEEAEVELAK